MAAKRLVVSMEHVESTILLIRGQRVMLDSDLAALYGVKVKALNQAVKRNRDRFPEDFMIQLSTEEFVRLRSQTVTASIPAKGMRSQFVTATRRNVGAPPYAFTEQGVAMLSSVLRSKRAVMVNIEIMRAFVRLRQILGAHADLARKLAALERKYDSQFKAVFDRYTRTHDPAAGKKASDRFSFVGIDKVNRQNQRQRGDGQKARPGPRAPQFHWPHVVANDTDGNMYIGEVDGAARVQKFLRYGATGCSGTGSSEVGKYVQ